MSILGRRVPARVVAGLAAMLVVAAMLPAAMRTPEGREVRLVARGMAFYLESDLEYASPNPVIDARAGETIRFVLRNEDRGMTHDLSIPAAANASKLLRWNEVGEVVINAPQTPGTYVYVCNPHQLMMKGILRVSAP